MRIHANLCTRTLTLIIEEFMLKRGGIIRAHILTKEAKGCWPAAQQTQTLTPC